MFIAKERTSTIKTTTSRNRARRLALVGAATLGVAASLAPAAVYNYFDTTFNNADWTSSKWADTTPGALATYTAVQQNPGGSPLAPFTPDYRQTTHSYNAGAIVVEHRGVLFNWAPGAGEVATSVDYEFDLIHETGATVGGAVGYSAAIYQGGNIYRAVLDNIFAPTWTRFPHVSLPLTAFAEVAPGTGAVNALSNPVGNAPMSFGYFSANSANQQTTKVSGLDNYNLTLHTVVPEPASATAVLGGAVATLCLRQRRKA